MAGLKGSPTGRCQGCNHSERVRIERLLAAGGSIKGAARKFAIDYHALHRHWRNHVSAEARATYVAGAGATKDQLEEIVADESLGLIDHYRIVRAALYQGFSAAAELADSNSLEPTLVTKLGRARHHWSPWPALAGVATPGCRSHTRAPAVTGSGLEWPRRAGACTRICPNAASARPGARSTPTRAHRGGPASSLPGLDRNPS